MSKMTGDPSTFLATLLITNKSATTKGIVVCYLRQAIQTRQTILL